LSFNWIENTLSDTGIWFLHMWIIRDRDESARLRVWYIIFWFNFLDIIFFQEILTIFRWSHVRLTTIGALRGVITIEALVVFLWTLKTFKFPFTLAFTMSEFLTLKCDTGFGTYGLTLAL
jgi:hypothetical protein